MTEITEAWLMQEFTKRAKACQLEVDCLGSGKIDSEICIISEAPGEREALMKMPMVGGSGKLLWDVLRPLDIHRKDCYVTNVVKRQVALSTKTNARSPVKKVEVEHWEGLLDWELDHLPNVKYLLILGNMALHAILGVTGISNWRGSVYDVTIGKSRRKVKAVITNNPGLIMRNIQMEPFYKFDVAKLRRVIDGRFKQHNIKPTINPTYGEALEYIDSLSRSTNPIAFDIEVMAGETACIGFANNGNTGISINFRDTKSNRYSITEERLLRQRIGRLLSDPRSKLIAQNASFDCGWLWYKDRIHTPKVWFDTLLAHHTLYPSIPHNLGFLTAQYTDHPYYKDEGKSWREGGNIDQFWEYNVKDCCITWAAHEGLLRELQSQNMEDFFFSHVMRLQPHLIQMQVGGVKLDMDLKESITERLDIELKDKLIDIQSQAVKLTDESWGRLNPNSPLQLGKFLFKELQLVGRGSSTNKENRDRIKKHPRTTDDQIKFIETLDSYKEDHKFFSTYATQRPDPDGRFRCEYKQFGVQAAPGRLSSSGTLWGSGGNLQNQPHAAYPMFVCDEDYMLSYFDLKQAEAKVVAYLWNVQGLIENFERAEVEEGFDVHRGNASRIFRIPYDEIPTSDYDDNGKRSLRYLGKRCVHGLNYRMQAPKLATVCSIPINQAEEAFASYHRAFPEINKAWQSTISTIRDERCLYTPLGRRFIILGRITEDSFDSVIAFVPQSTIGDKVSSVIYLCHEDEEWPEDARMLLNIHDALIAIHKPTDKETVQRLMKKHAETPITIRGNQVSIGTDFKESTPDEKGIHRWSTLKDLTS